MPKQIHTPEIVPLPVLASHALQQLTKHRKPTAWCAMLKRLLCLLLCLLTPAAASAQSIPGTTDHYFITSDGVRLHYLEAGPRDAPTLVFIPGWAMPAWIFAPQIRAFAPCDHVIAFDPRGQGSSDIPTTGYNQDRRGQDISELLQTLGPRPVILVAWSLGVLDTLAYIHNSGDAQIAGLVFVDNSVGENPPPRPEPQPRSLYHRLTHAQFMRAFVTGMFHTKQSSAYLNRLTQATLRLPENDAHALLTYPVPRSYWLNAILSTNKPVLYIVRPHLAGQAQNLLLDRPNTQIAIFPTAGHALFVDAAPRFNALLATFLHTQIAPQ
jgi:microsomal epoxide hydrolase